MPLPSSPPTMSPHDTSSCLGLAMCTYRARACVCVCERERERERLYCVVCVWLVTDNFNNYLQPVCVCVRVCVCVCVCFVISNFENYLHPVLANWCILLELFV
jgi:hypothetical protein